MYEDPHQPVLRTFSALTSVMLASAGLVVFLFAGLTSCFGGFVFFPVAALLAALGLWLGCRTQEGCLSVAGILLNVIVLVLAGLMMAQYLWIIMQQPA